MHITTRAVLNFSVNFCCLIISEGVPVEDTIYVSTALCMGLFDVCISAIYFR